MRCYELTFLDEPLNYLIEVVGYCTSLGTGRFEKPSSSHPHCPTHNLNLKPLENASLTLLIKGLQLIDDGA